jgi:hypothetical protein
MTRLQSQDDMRLALTSAAARAERANQPRHLVLLSAAVLAGALLMLALAWRSYAAARASLDDQRTQAARVVETAARLRALRQARDQDDGSRTGVASQQVLTRIEQLGREAGLRDRLVAPRTNSARPQGATAVRTTWEYDVRDPSLGAIMDWCTRVPEQMPDLEVYAIRVRPEAQAWFVTVTFRRWERAE